MPTITKTTKVLERDDNLLAQTWPDSVYFIQRDEETREVLVDLEITRNQYEALGRPEKLTVTLQPGDKLNEDA
jgi:Txe/YoeB family toxin of Txe-Axe toxin-antitoxin module